MDDSAEISLSDQPVAEGQELIITCPECQGEVLCPVDAWPSIVCPHCQQPISLQAIYYSDETAEAEAEREDELDGMRIQKIARARRAANRARSYLIVAAFGGFVGALEAFYKAYEALRSGSGRRIGEVLISCGIGLLILAHYFFKQIFLPREGENFAFEALSAPDFSLLNDGSQVARQLEEMHRGNGID